MFAQRFAMDVRNVSLQVDVRAKHGRESFLDTIALLAQKVMRPEVITQRLIVPVELIRSVRIAKVTEVVLTS